MWCSRTSWAYVTDRGGCVFEKTRWKESVRETERERERVIERSQIKSERERARRSKIETETTFRYGEEKNKKQNTLVL